MSSYPKMQTHRWSDEERAYLAEVTPGHSHREITQMMNDRFEHKFTVENIKSAINRYKLNTGRTGCFEKGHVSHNKGKKWDEFMSKEGQAHSRTTTFKHGHMPANGSETPVGTERSGKDGYIEVKFCMVGNKEHRPSGGSRCWKQKHRMIWEEAYGNVPDGHHIVFADRNKRNFDLDNLVCVSQADMATINKLGIAYHNAQTLLAAIAIAKLAHKTRDLLLNDRVCRKCGKTFKPRYENQRTCDECLDMRRQAKRYA